MPGILFSERRSIISLSSVRLQDNVMKRQSVYFGVEAAVLISTEMKFKR
jgi:hypothetical protein